MPRARLTHDAYMTPRLRRVVSELHAGVNLSGLVLEPCAGDGGLVSLLREIPGLTVEGKDLDPEYGWPVADAREAHAYDVADWVVTNPPFGQALAIAQAAVASGANVALLLRLSFLEPTKDRAAWLRANPPSGQIVMPRMRFRADTAGTDSVTCAWMIWERAVPVEYRRIRIAKRFEAA